MMTDKRFNELLNGPLYHPTPMLAIGRLAMGLRAVIDATGELGERALEAHCAERQQRDDDNARS